MDVIVGTAGHIDHGKTALVKALTGIDADRLPEEKQRGITIDLGFAELVLDGVRFGFVDVPGHERFVKNMLAGASGIDIVLLVVAADEGVMPQTREHFEICRLLGTRNGIVALTKADLVDEEALVLAKQEVAELVAGSFLEKAPVVVLSSTTGDGVSDLSKVLVKSAASIPERDDYFVARLPIDRSFSVKGFGCVVTGTLRSGEIAEGDELEILPSGNTVRVRGLQTFGQSVNTVRAGQRAAVNLVAIDKGEIGRGMMLATQNVLRPTQMLDTRLEVLSHTDRALRSRQRIRVHIGTSEILARLFVLNDSGEIPPGRSDLAQLRLETSVAAVSGERFIIRSYSPPTTLAGGTVLDPLPTKHKRKDILEIRSFLGRLETTGDDRALRLKYFIDASGANGCTISDLQARTGWLSDILRQTLRETIDDQSVIDAGDIYISQSHFEKLKDKAVLETERHHKSEPLARGLSKETLKERAFAYVATKVFKAVLAALEAGGKISVEHDSIRLAEHKAQLSPGEALALKNLKTIYKNAGLAVPNLEDALIEATRATGLTRTEARKVFQMLLDLHQLIKVNDALYISQVAICDLRGKLKDHAATSADRSIDVPKFKEIAQVSRKYAIPLLEYFDREKITQRVADKRIIL